jgi:GH15 family glucan-1,4-alpha-glucosidase
MIEQNTSTPYPAIKDLAVIGDRRSCALLTKAGSICWYCPERFDKPAVLSSLLDTEKGGYWSFDLKGKKFQRRAYKEDSSILTSWYQSPVGDFTVTDWMPVNSEITGICRLFSVVPDDIDITLKIVADYGQSKASIKQHDHFVLIKAHIPLYFTASHPVSIDGDILRLTIPKGEEGWAMLTNEQPDHSSLRKQLDKSLRQTLSMWEDIASQVKYEGPYRKQVYDSMRAIRLLTKEDNGGVIAAATTSLPEIAGGNRNYDYRYVWLRDAAMIVSALTRAGSNGKEERKFLSFLCDAKHINKQESLVPLYSLDGAIAPAESYLNLNGYKSSRPVRVGNDAKNQIQLDANGNVLLAAKLIYNEFGVKDHWETIQEIADYLTDNWQKPDHGIWEEHIKKQFTSSKVIVAQALKFIADHATSSSQARKWKDASHQIRQYIEENCITSQGAYAVYAGSEDVDITAALYPVWAYTDPDTEVMLKTIELLERDYKQGSLYRRHLIRANSADEGVFLAAAFWMAQYYIMVKKLDKCKEIMDAAFRFSTDLGFFAEEGDLETGDMLGNFPQTFVHASLIGTIVDYKHALEQQ